MIRIDQLEFQYARSDFKLTVPELAIEKGQKIAIVGPSGSGKTTLLNLLAGINVPDSGQITVAGQDVGRLHDAQRRNFRIQQIGMVFQRFELIEYLSAIDNILIPFWVNSNLKHNSFDRKQALNLAEEMGIADKIHRRPDQLSQGEQQREAICRALISQPQLILADEPTGNLDPDNKRLILEILFRQADKNQQTLVVVTHDVSILSGFDKTIDFNQFRERADQSSVSAGATS